MKRGETSGMALVATSGARRKILSTARLLAGNGPWVYITYWELE